MAYSRLYLFRQSVSCDFILWLFLENPPRVATKIESKKKSVAAGDEKSDGEDEVADE